MRITVWNINGLRTLKGYQPWYKLPDWEACLEHLGADIACFQETKMTRKQLTEAMCILPSYNAFFNFHPTKGYSGTVTYVRKSASIPLKAEQGITGRLCDTPAPSNPTIPNEPIGHVPADTRDDVEPQLWQALDDEGRAVVVDLGLFVLFNVYCPNETGPERLEYKMTYYQCLAERAHRLIAAGRNVMIVGDMNIIRDPIDHCDPEQSMRENGWDHFHQHPARAWFASFLAPQGKFHDVGRMFHPERRKMFTCWNTLIDARPANYGVRLDYTLVSEGLLPWVKGADIQPDIYGSDHCPIYIDLHDEREVDGKTVRLAELMHGGATRLPPALAACHYDEFSGKQRKLASFFSAARTPAIKRTDIPSASDTPKGASSQQTESASVGATAAGLAPPQAQDSQHAITSGESDAESSSLVDSLFSLHSQQEGLHVEYASQAPRSEQAAALPSTPSPTKPNPAQTASPVASAPARASMVPRKDSSAEASPMKRNGGSPKRTVASKGKDAAKGKSAAGLKGQTSLQAFFARPASSFSDAADTDTDSAEQAPPSQPSSQVDHVGASADASDAGAICRTTTQSRSSRSSFCVSTTRRWVGAIGNGPDRRLARMGRHFLAPPTSAMSPLGGVSSMDGEQAGTEPRTQVLALFAPRRSRVRKDGPGQGRCEPRVSVQLLPVGLGTPCGSVARPKASPGLGSQVLCRSRPGSTKSETRPR